MKCVNCGADNNLKERTANQGRCKNCNHTFAFEPNSADIKYKFSDPFFQNIINDISGGTYEPDILRVHDGPQMRDVCRMADELWR